MKKILISEIIKGFDGKELQKDFTVKSVLLNLFGSAQAASGEEAIKIVKLGQDIYSSKDEFHFEEANESLIKKIIEQGITKFTAIVIAKLKEIIDNAMAYKPKEGKDETKS